MKIYLISQEENNSYDTYDSAVVIAPDESYAIDMDPSSGDKIDWLKEAKRSWTSWATNRDSVSVTYLGESAKDEIMVVCASYNAG